MRRSFLAVALLGLVLTLASTVSAQTTITIMDHDQRNEEADMDAIARFEVDHPNVKVDVVWENNIPVSRFRTMAAGGVAPDVWIYDTGSLVSPLWIDGSTLDLTDYVAKSQDHFKDWFPGVLEMGTLGGKQYAIPRQSIYSYLQYYNRDVLDAAGITYPSNDWTWDDFKDMGKKVTKDTNGDGAADIYATDWTWYSFRMWLDGAGSEVHDPTGRKIIFDSPESRQGLQFLFDMEWKDHIIPQPSDGMGSAPAPFYTGNLAMVHRQSNLWIYLKDNNTNAGVVLDPIGPTGVRRTMATTQAFMVSAFSQNPDLAYELIMYLTDAKAASMSVRSGALPVNAKVAQTEFGQGVDVLNFRKGFIESVSQPMFLALGTYPGVSQFRRLFRAVVRDNTMTIPQAMEEYVLAAQNELDEFWKAADATDK